MMSELVGVRIAQLGGGRAVPAVPLSRLPPRPDETADRIRLPSVSAPGAVHP